MQYFYDQSKSFLEIADIQFPSPKRGIAVGVIRVSAVPALRDARERVIRLRRDQPDSPAMRLTSASDHPSVVVLISVVGSSMQRVGSKPYLTFECLASWLRSEESMPSVEN
jgi:hypothetical protein